MALLVKVGADLNSFNKKMRKFERSIGYMNRKMKDLGKAMTRRVTLPLVALGGYGVKVAGDMEASMSKFNTVFKGQEKQVSDWAETFRKKFPVAKKEVYGLSAGLDDMLSPIIKNERQSAKMTQNWMELAGYLASFNGTSVANVMQDIQSAVAGSNETLNKYGIVAKEAELKQRALQMGLIEQGEELNQTARQQALLTLATEASKAAIEGFDESTSNFNFKLQELKASLQNLALAIGQKLMPVVQPIIQKITEWLGRFNELDSSTQQFIVLIGAAVAVIGPLLIGIASLITLFGAAAAAIGLSLGVILLIVAAIGLLVAGVIALYVYWDEIVDFFAKTTAKIATFFSKMVTSVGIMWDSFKAFGKAAVNGVIGYLNTYLSAWKTMINNVIGIANKGVKGLNKVPGVNIPLIPSLGKNAMKIPMLAKGGIVTSATQAIIGEAGPEAVIPLNKLDSMLGGKNNKQNINLYLDKRKIAEAVVDEMGNVMHRRTGLRLS